MKSPGAGHDETGFAAVVLDRLAVDTGVSGWILEYIDTFGLNPLLARELTRAEKSGLRAVMPNGETRYAFDPHLFLPTIDLAPDPPSRDDLRRAPDIDNARILKVTDRCRSTLRRRCPWLTERPMVRVSRNSREAWEWVRSVMGEQEPSLREMVEARRQAFQAPFPVLDEIGGSARERAKVEIVDFHGQAAVCKTFRPGKEHFLQREIEALEALQDEPEVPRVLARGENWFVMPLFEDSGRFRPNRLGMLPLKRSKELIQVLEKLFAAGYAHLDLRSANVISDERQGLKLLDFEFAHRYSTRPTSFDESYDIVGAPGEAEKDTPPHGVLPHATYGNRLQHLTGLSFGSLRQDPEWKQHVKRAFFIVTRAVPRMVNRWVREKLGPAR